MRTQQLLSERGTCTINIGDWIKKSDKWRVLETVE